MDWFNFQRLSTILSWILEIVVLVEGALIRTLLYMKEVVIHTAFHIDRLRPAQCCALCVP